MTATKEPRQYEWAHGWIPLTLHAAGVDPLDLFTGTEAHARKYASDELLTYWHENGRLTLDDFRAGVLGGHMRHKGGTPWA